MPRTTSPTGKKRRPPPAVDVTKAIDDALAAAESPPKGGEEKVEEGEPRPVDDPSKIPEPWKTADHQAKLPEPPRMKHGFEKIVKSIFDDGYDPFEEYEQIKAALEVNGALTPGALAAAAEAQEAIAIRAVRLWVVTKHQVTAYVRETDAIVGAMREAAVAKLERDKVKKIRTKQITDADVVATASQMYPDQWQTIDDRRQKADLMVKFAEKLMEISAGRSATLRNLVNPGPGRGKTIG